MSGEGQQQQSQSQRALYDLCSLVLTIIRSPPLPPSPPENNSHPHRRQIGLVSRPRQQLQVTPEGIASLLLGVSLAMMFCGYVTFMIGFILMPWVIAMVMVLSFVGIVSNLSGLGRSILSPAPALSPGRTPSSSKDMSVTRFPLTKGKYHVVDLRLSDEPAQSASV